MPFLEAGALPHMISILDWAHAAVWICVRTEVGKSRFKERVLDSLWFRFIPRPSNVSDL